MRILLLLLLPSLAFGFSCPDQKKVESIAKDLIHIEFSGIRISGQESSPCLDQKKFKHYSIVYDAPNEDFLGKTGTIKSAKSLKIKKVELIDSDVHLYKATYSIKTVGNKVIEDSISFFRYMDSRNQKMYGCAGVTTPPESRLILSKCEVK